MTDEMIERVARAICAARCLDWDAQADPMTSAGGGEDQEGFLEDARAAIDAMREPTEEMVRLGDDAAENETYDRNGGQAAFSMDGSKSVWQAMIDAALAQGIEAATAGETA